MYFRYCNLFFEYEHLCGITLYAQKMLGDELIDFCVRLHILEFFVAVENKELITDEIKSLDYLYESTYNFDGMEVIIKTSSAAGITFVAVFDNEDNARAD